MTCVVVEEGSDTTHSQREKQKPTPSGMREKPLYMRDVTGVAEEEASDMTHCLCLTVVGGRRRRKKEECETLAGEGERQRETTAEGQEEGEGWVGGVWKGVWRDGEERRE